MKKINFEFIASIVVEGQDFDATISGDAFVSCDNSYGADADGNRGCTEYFVEDINIESIILEEEGYRFYEKQLQNIEKIKEEICDYVIEDFQNQQSSNWE